MSGKSIVQGLMARLATSRFVRDALMKEEDPATIASKPTPRIWMGLGLIGLSYIIGWPAVGLLAWISYHLKEPLIVVAGGPVTYGLSHVVFWIGLYCAGTPYIRPLLQWAARRLVKRLEASSSEGNPPKVFATSFRKEQSGRMRSSPFTADIRGAPSPAMITGATAFPLAGLLLLIRPKLAMIPLALFVLACMVAPFLPGFGFFLPVISRGKKEGRSVALTFDDGPDPEISPRLLELLRCHGAPATFFVTGAKAERYPELIRGILSHGHTIGNHSYHHDPLLMLRSRATLRNEIALAQDALAVYGIRPLTFRPPVGITNPKLSGVLKELGMDCVNFSCRALDFGNRRIEGLAEIILGKVRPGDIILLHDVVPKGGDGAERWIAEIERILSGLTNKEYEILPLSDLIDRSVMAHLHDSNERAAE